MSSPPDTSDTTGVRHRRPRAGTRNRGAADALQTKIAIGVLNLDPNTYEEQLRTNIAELPDAAGCDAAFVVLISEDGTQFESVISSTSRFAQTNPEVLAGESVENWSWLSNRLGHLKVVEVADTLKGSKSSEGELERLSELHIGSILMIGFSVHGEVAGFLALANELPVESWDANLHLLLKLVGASLATGLERAQDREVLNEMNQRNELAWTLTLDPGETRTLTYRYSVLVLH